MAKRWLASGAIAMGLVAAGCGGSGDQTADPGSSPSMASSGTSSGCSVPADGKTLGSILALVPDSPENRGYLTVSDLRAFLDDQDATLPDDFGEIRFVDPVALFAPSDLLQQAVMQRDDDPDPLATEYGISIGQVDRAVSFGEPPDTTDLLIGSFDPAAVATAVEAEPVWSDELEQATSNGQTFYTWGEDNKVSGEGRTPMRQLGIGGRLWAGDTVAGFTRSTAVMEDLLAACTGAAPSLGDDPAFAGIAERLDAFDEAFNVTFTDQVSDGTDPSPRGSTPASPASDVATPLAGVTAYGFASGPSDDPEQARIRLVIASGSDEQAAANETAFADIVETGASVTTRRPWSDLLQIESSEVDGRFLVVELRASNSRVLDNAVLERDTLVVTEG